MDMLLVLPLLIPLITAVVMLLFWQQTQVQRWLDVAGTAMLFATGLLLFAVVSRNGIQAVQIGGWPAPYGITLVADLFSAIMLVLIGLIGLLIAIYGLAALDDNRRRAGYHPLAQLLLLSLVGAVLTGDIFNLFVWFEVMLISSFVLLTLGGGRDQIEGAYKYVALNLFASSLFLAAVGILYGVTGTLNMGDLAVRFASGVVEPGLIATLAVLFLIALGIKSAIFPLFFWLPASYHTAPVGGFGALRRPPDQGRGLCADPSLHAALHPGDGQRPDAVALGGRFHHGRRRAGRGRAERDPAHSLLPHRQPDRLHDHGVGALHAAGAGRRHLLHRPQHHRQDQPLPDRRRRRRGCRARRSSNCWAASIAPGRR